MSSRAEYSTGQFVRRWCRFLFNLFVIVATVVALFPKARPAYASASAGLNPATQVASGVDIDPCDLRPLPPECVILPPPELLYLKQGGLYAATEAQTASLRNLENQAIQAVRDLHSLPPEDEAALRTWGRDSVLAQLYILLGAAIKTNAAERTADQQNAVEWISTVAKRTNVAAAQSAAREYVKWAGLGRSNFDAMMRTNPTKAQIEAFLSGTVVNYDFPGGTSTEGWCVYRSPAPYADEYTGFNHPLCIGPVIGFYLPPTPSYDEFVKWGIAKANYPLLSSPGFLSRAQTLGIGLGIGLPLSAIASGAAPVVLALRAVASSVVAAEVFGETAGTFFSVATRFSVLTGATIFLTVLAALVTAVLLGINITDAATLPGKLATLVDTARTTEIDASTLLTDTDSKANLFSLFIGVTTPMPKAEACDNSLLPPSGMAELTAIDTDEVRLLSSAPCLNTTRILRAAATDSQFMVKGSSGAEAFAPSLNVKDTASGTVTTVRLSGNWFITTANGTTAQSLRLAYTDWDNTQQSAWLIGNASTGFVFLTAAVDSSATENASSCLGDNTCSAGATIKYIGADGGKYSAWVRGYQAPTGTPTVSGAEEDIPAVLDAGGFAPGGAVAPITYRWSFKGSKCAIYLLEPCPELASATGATVSYTWKTGGTYQVDLTATDASGAQATTTLQVPVASLPPTFAFAPDCATSPNELCNTWSGSQGTSVAFVGTMRYTGSESSFTITVQWGDNTSTYQSYDMQRINSDGSVGRYPGDTSPISVTKIPGELAYRISVPHTYANPGVYNGSITVRKNINVFDDGGTVVQPFTFNIRAKQTISFPNIGGSSYGNVFPISATGGASGQPVTFSATSSCTLSNVNSGAGTGSATVTIVSAGFCDITARQNGSADFDPAPSVTQRVFIQLAPLTITAPSPTITYGQLLPALTPSYSGFKLSNTAATLTTPATCVVAPNAGVAGAYATNCAGAAGPNYSFNYVAGTLTITKAPLTITANNKTIVYGQTVPSFDATFDGLVKSESSSVVSGLACSASNANGQPISGSTPVGNYPITCSGGSAMNYNLSYVAGTLTINKAATTTTLSAAPASSLLGKAVTFTAAVAVTSPGSGTPSGTVTFLDGGTPITGCTARPLDPTSRTATCTTTALSVGQRTITATYSGDARFASNSATPTAYTVAYSFSSFSGPVDNAPIVNVASAGRIIPLKWRVLDGLGNPITTLTRVSVTSTVGACSGSAPSDAVETYTTSNSGLQNLGKGYYQFNWQSERGWAGSCRTLRLDLGDGVARTALFQFR